MRISQKVNLIAPLGFELANYDVQHVSHYAADDPIGLLLLTDPLDSLLPSYPSFRAGLQHDIQCPLKADEGKFLYSSTDLSICRNPYENVSYVFVPGSPDRFSMSCSSNFNVL